MTALPRIAVAHTFATGPSLAEDRLFQVGVRAVGTGRDEPRIWTINPERKLPRHAYDASRVSTAEAAAAPLWDTLQEEVAEHFRRFDYVFVYAPGQELAWIERHILSRQPGAGTRRAEPARPQVVDLHALAALLLPARAVGDMEALIERAVPARAYRRGSQQMPFLLRAFDMLLGDLIRVVLTASSEGGHPVHAILQQLGGWNELPADLAALLRLAGEAHAWPATSLFAFDRPRTPEAFPYTRKGMLALLLEAYPPVDPSGSGTDLDAKTGPGATGETASSIAPLHTNGDGHKQPLSPVRPAYVEAAFERLRTAAGQGDGSWRDRPEQLRYARFCASALSRGGLYAAEGGTGTGKTLGYLVPACDFVQRNPEAKVIIATSTKNLQGQVLAGELPRLTGPGSLYIDVQGALLKGKSNFLCLSALAEYYEVLYRGQKKGTADERLAWLHLFLRALHGDGVLEHIPYAVRRRLPALGTLIEEVQAGEACEPSLCEAGQRCVYPRHLQAALDADIVVTNHHKLASLPARLLEDQAVCIIDEGDLFPDNFREALRLDVSERSVRRFLQRLVGGRKRRGYLEIFEDRLVKYTEEATGGTALLADGAVEQTRSAEQACTRIHAAVAAVGKLVKPPQGDATRWQEMPGDDFDELILDRLGALGSALEALEQALAAVVVATRKMPANMRRELPRLERYRAQAEALQQDVAALRTDYRTEAWVHTCERGYTGWLLARTPYDLTGATQRHLREPYHAVVFTSATLYVDEQLAFFEREMGLGEPLSGALRTVSPFDYAARVHGGVMTSGPCYDYRMSRDQRRAWKDYVVGMLATLSLATNGRTLVLLTNAAEMEAVARRLGPMLGGYGIDVLVQQGSSLAEIERFRASEHTVLLGVDRFWTGVDFPGTTLSQVIMVRVPNPPLNRPMIRHRRAYGGDAFWRDYYRPVTRLKMRQGFGRLIRSESDRGLFVVLDQRLALYDHIAPLAAEFPVTLHHVCMHDTQAQGGGNGYGVRAFIEEGLGTARLRSEFVQRGIDPLRLLPA